MKLTLERLAEIINDLSYLYAEYGDVITSDEAEVIRKILVTATNSGIEFLDKEQTEFAIGVYKKYEGKNLISSEDEGEVE